MRRIAILKCLLLTITYQSEFFFPELQASSTDPSGSDYTNNDQYFLNQGYDSYGSDASQKPIYFDDYYSSSTPPSSSNFLHSNGDKEPVEVVTQWKVNPTQASHAQTNFYGESTTPSKPAKTSYSYSNRPIDESNLISQATVNQPPRQIPAIPHPQTEKINQNPLQPVTPSTAFTPLAPLTAPTTPIAPIAPQKINNVPTRQEDSSANDFKAIPSEINKGFTLPQGQTENTNRPHNQKTHKQVHKDEASEYPSNGVREISINFNNVAMIEYIRFISRITNKNFVFDDADLQFNITIVSEEATSIQNLMAALLQELKIRDFSLLEQGNNIIIHRNQRVRAPAHIVAEGLPNNSQESEIITRVFRLNTLDPNKAAEIIKPLLSDDALVEVLRDTNNLVITDLSSNIQKIAQLISSLDSPNSGTTIGQYVVQNAFVDTLAILADKILQPIAQGNPFQLVPYTATNSIFIVSNAFIVERALAILQILDNNEARTKIFSLGALKFNEEEQKERDRQAQINGKGPGGFNAGGLGQGGRLPGVPSSENFPPNLETNGAAPGTVPGILPGTMPGYPYGTGNAQGAVLTDQNFPSPRTFAETQQFSSGVLSSAPRWNRELPVGHIERTFFYIHKLRYRRGDQIEIALRKIADSLQVSGLANADLVSAILSTQWIESSNSIIITGTGTALERLRDLIDEVDTPLRQVFIEMLVLNATISDSLKYGVEWGDRFGGGNTAGIETFLGGGPLSSVLNQDASGALLPGQFPDPRLLSQSSGFSLGIIGRHLTHNGTRFNTIGALVTAIHDDTKANIILNPKIITEDNHTAEIFVGSTTRYKTQSIANDLGGVITNNFQFLDVGTTLRVTPLIGNDDVITLDIIQEITTGSNDSNPPTNTAVVDINLVPILNKNRTVTKVHVPNGCFIVLSGMIQDSQSRTESRVPCLGGIPIIGAANKNKSLQDDKNNLMIFIRPLIVDTQDELEALTRRQQDIYTEKNKYKRKWNFEIDEALDFVNIRPTDPDEIGCTIR